MPNDNPGQQPAAEHPAAQPPAAQPAPAEGAQPPTEQPPAAPAAQGDKPWWDGVQEQPIRDFMQAKNYKDPNEAARALWNLNRVTTIQGDVQAVFDGKATPEQEANFYSKLGRPASAEKYDLKPGEGVEVHAELDKAARTFMFEAGLTQKQAAKVYEAHNKAVIAINAAQAEKERADNETALKALETSWGPELEANKAAGMRVLEALKLPDDVMQKIESSVGVAGVVQLLAAIGRKSGEGTFKGGDNNQADPNNPDTMSAEQAKARVQALMADTDFQNAIQDKKNPDRKAKLEYWEKLNARAGS